MSSRSSLRPWIALASVALLLVGALAGTAAARPLCAVASADAVKAPGACCAKNSMADSEADAGTAMCSLQCSASGCTAVIAPRQADLEPALAVPAAPPPSVYAGWRPAPAPPPPRSIVLA